MDDRTLAALDASILHWEQNLDAEKSDDARVGMEDCALCGMFVEGRDPDDACSGCPVRDRTGEDMCEETPYAAAYFAWRRWDVPPEDHALRAVFRSRAQKEIDFLRSLRPVDK